MIQCILTAVDSEASRRVHVDVLGRSPLKVLCPWHHEVTPSCVISLDKAIFYCFGCHMSGRVLLEGGRADEELLEEYRFVEAQALLTDKEMHPTREQWWEAYRQYLTTPIWREKRRRVIQRAGGICEGCGSARATQVHHLTYKRVGREMLFDLVAICEDCHHSLHEKRNVHD